jgi:hypothetical protein
MVKDVEDDKKSALKYEALAAKQEHKARLMLAHAENKD